MATLQIVLWIIATCSHYELSLVPLFDSLPNLIRSVAAIIKKINIGNWHACELSEGVVGRTGYELNVVDVELGHRLLEKSSPPRSVFALFGRYGSSVLVNGESIVKVDELGFSLVPHLNLEDSRTS